MEAIWLRNPAIPAEFTVLKILACLSSLQLDLFPIKLARNNPNSLLSYQVAQNGSKERYVPYIIKWDSGNQ